MTTITPAAPFVPLDRATEALLLTGARGPRPHITETLAAHKLCDAVGVGAALARAAMESA